MATKNKEKETAGTQAVPRTESQAAQEAPATVTDASAGETNTKVTSTTEKADKNTAAVKEEKKPKPAASVLEKAGKAAIARHGFKEVFVTSDGQVFPLSSDAKNHASDLSNKEIIKVAK